MNLREVLERMLERAETNKGSAPITLAIADIKKLLLSKEEIQAILDEYDNDCSRANDGGAEAVVKAQEERL
jgi:hypothetical protein